MTDQEILQQFENMNKRMDQMQELIMKSLAALNDKIDAVDQRLNDKIDTVDQRLNDKIDAVDQHLNGKIDAVERRLTARQDQFEEHMLKEFQKQTDTLDARIAQAESKFDEAAMT